MRYKKAVLGDVGYRYSIGLVLHRVRDSSLL